MKRQKNGRNYFQQGNHVYDRLEVSEALQQAFKTWAKWADSTVDSKHTYKGLFHWIFSFSLQARRMCTSTSFYFYILSLLCS